jgi:hypothetical protein
MKLGIALLLASSLVLVACESDKASQTSAFSITHNVDRAPPKVVTARDCPSTLVSDPHPRAAMGLLLQNTAQVLLQNCQAIKFGGYAWNSSLELNGPVSTVMAFSPATNSWEKRAPMPIATFSSAAAVMGDGRVLLTGGFTKPDQAFTGAALYDPEQNVWLALPSPHHAHGYAKAITLTAGEILVVGGGSSEIFDLGTNAWSSPLDFPLNDGKILSLMALPSGNVFAFEKTTGGAARGALLDLRAANWHDTKLDGYDGVAAQSIMGEPIVAKFSPWGSDKDVLFVQTFDEANFTWRDTAAIKGFHVDFPVSDGWLSQTESGKLLFWGTYAGSQIDFVKNTAQTFATMQSGTNFVPPNQPIELSPGALLITPSLNSEIIPLPR